MVIFILLSIMVFHLVVLAKTIFFPYPEFFVYPYLTNNGLIPYRDILDQHFPGLMFLPINFNNLGLLTPTDARIWQLGLVTLVHILLFIVAKRLFGSSKKALLASFMYFLWQPFFEGWVLWIDSILPIFFLGAFYFLHRGLEDKKVKNFVLTGLIFGLATVFKQIVIPFFVLVFVYSFFNLKSPKKLKLLSGMALGYLPLPVLMVLYILNLGVFPDFWYWTVAFNVDTFAKFGRKFATFSEVVRVGYVFGFALLGNMVRSSRRDVHLVLLFMVGALIAAYARFDFVHLQPALPFAVLGSVYALTALKRGCVTIPFIPIYFMGVLVLLFTFYRGHLGDRIFFFDRDLIAVAEKIKETTDPGEKIFLYGAPLHLYQMSETLPAGDVFVFQFQWFMMKAEARTLDGIKTDKPKLIVADRAVTIQGEKITDFMSEIDEYVLTNYELRGSVGPYEFYYLKDVGFAYKR